MKLGVSYNIFDGEELLKGSIKQIRDKVDYISVVYQTISNFGNPCSPGLELMLKNLKSIGLVDELFLYMPNLNGGGHFNEIRKRNIGLQLSKKNNCTHHMSMDSDEYYLSSEFENMKNQIIEQDYDSSYCQMVTYYKSWEYRLDPFEDYYVSLIYKIDENSMYSFNIQSPVLVDPTRRMSGVKNPILFTRDQLQMHHGSYIRNNIERKLKNSSSRNQDWDVNKIKKHFNSFSDGDKALMFKPFEEYVDLIKVKNLFE